MIVVFAWRQLFRQRSRLAAATAGIVFAVVLIMVQLGFQAALYQSATLHYDHMTADIILLSPQYEAIMYNNSGFPAQRLNQAYAVDGVASTLAMYGSFVAWKNPWTHKERTMYMFGFNPVPGYFDLGAIKDPGPLLRKGDSVLFDELSRKEYGDVPSAFRAGKRVVTEMVGHRVEVAGLFSAGTSFGIGRMWLGIATSPNEIVRDPIALAAMIAPEANRLSYRLIRPRIRDRFCLIERTSCHRSPVFSKRAIAFPIVKSSGPALSSSSQVRGMDSGAPGLPRGE